MNEPSAMSTFLSSIGDAVTQYTTWIGSVVSTITGQPLLLIGFVVPIFGGAIGLFKRLCRV